MLETGLERAIALSESMDARGYGHQAPARVERVSGWVAFAGLAAIGAGFVALVSRAGTAALALTVVGVAALVGAIAVSSRAIVRTRYRPRSPALLDYAVMLGTVIAPLGIVVAALLDEPSLRWIPTEFSWPPVNLAVVAALCCLATPSLVRPNPAPSLAAASLPGEAAWTR